MDQVRMHALLVGTRNAIAERGHAKGALEDDYGRVCLYGGFNVASKGDPRAFSGREEGEAFASVLGFVAEDVNRADWDRGLLLSDVAVLWNNAPERTKEEVLARLDEAIARTAPEPEDPLRDVEPVPVET